MDVNVETIVNTHDLDLINEALWDARVLIEEDLGRSRSLQEVKIGSVPKALLLIAAKFSTGRQDLVAAVLDAILLQTVYAFQSHGTITVGIRAEDLAEDLKKSIRSIQEILQDIERCGFCARGKGGEFNGLTGLRLTRTALRDPNTRWVLSMKGKNAPGFVEWLTEQQLEAAETTSTETVRYVASNTSNKTRDFAPKTSKTSNRARDFASPLVTKVIKPSSSEEKREREASSPDEIPVKSASATELSFAVSLLQALLAEYGLTGFVPQNLFEEFDDSAWSHGLSRRDLVDYLDFKLWELVGERKEKYKASTTVRILTRDLIHYKAVITNLSSLRRSRAEQQARQEAPEIEDVLEGEEAKETYFKPVFTGPLEAWQKELKTQVGQKNWDEFLSNARLNLTDELPELWVRDGFHGQWIANRYPGAIVASVGPCRICWLNMDHSEAITLKSAPEPPQCAGEVFTVTTSGKILSDEVLEPWQEKLRDTVPGSGWRIYLKHLRRESPAGEPVILSCEDTFLAEWVASKYSGVLTENLGPVELRSGERVWALTKV